MIFGLLETEGKLLLCGFLFFFIELMMNTTKVYYHLVLYYTKARRQIGIGLTFAKT